MQKFNGLRLMLVAGWLTWLATSGVALAAVLSQGYSSSSQLPPGTIVSLSGQGSNQVVAASSQNVNDLVGVVTAINSSLALSTIGQNLQVATSGVTNAWVSDASGSIKSGDSITASGLEGVGMKAKDNTEVVGVAQTGFDSHSAGATQRTVQGQKAPVAIGMIPVLVQVSYYNANGSSQNVLLQPLQKIANNLAQKPVSVTRVTLAGVILVLALLITATLVYAAVRSSIVSIGRNPLSAHPVLVSLIQVLLAVTAVLAATLLIDYLIITRA